MNNIQLTDIAKAKAFALWAKSATGIEPEIINVDNQYLEIKFTNEEIQAWKRYLDSVLFKSVKPAAGQPAPVVQIRFGEVLLPWASRYLIALIIAGVVLGRISKR